MFKLFYFQLMRLTAVHWWLDVRIGANIGHAAGRRQRRRRIARNWTVLIVLLETV